ncbi:Pkinase-domain-containing protein [Cutaneotrichosporon oleaginosum]|uniref:Pkinase-domain-containing protein n=1 Tax=Cutaneotrichosporon oleaginosum TaxID=879819 RepID=A0A0J0XTT4_9TREE|nr:Pkinase-domain-containing protein [Cutaneotrichosporon oleaginosum]KLT44506.1 Pkinase-domain-containing protein [Cutaneotrichosporon oleaginosum]
MAAAYSGRQGHSYSNNVANTKQAQLTTAYSSLAQELASDNLKVVGGYTLGKVIGEGTFGSVHIACHRLTGMRCAIKKIAKASTPQLTREIHHHRRLHHPHIVHLHEIIATENHIWLVSELCPGGELFDYLVERGRILEGEARRIFGELCTAVGWLHRQGIVHRDLKLENVLLDGELGVKLGDLGFAREYQKGRFMETFCGTTGYASPEMLACKKYLGVETDIWSLGIILYTLLCGGLPFDDDDERVMKDLIIKGEYEEPEWLTEDARSLIRGMLQSNPEKRLHMEGILTHPWFKKTIYDNIHNASSTLSLPTSGPTSPIAHPMASTESIVNRKRLSTSSISSFPFTPRTSSGPQLPLTQEPTALATFPEGESEPSETSFEFSGKQSTSGDTSPTTAENEEEADIKRTHSGETSLTERALELAHKNSSEATLRKPDSLRERLARMSLEGPREEDENEGYSRADERLSASNLPMIDEHSLALPLADHSRTPVRTKRRSLTSQLPLERRLSHHSTSSQWQAFVADDYLALLKAELPPLFSTPSEKLLLERLVDLGFDVGQLMHSVKTDACDSSSAMWWILRLKQLERGETDDASGRI